MVDPYRMLGGSNDPVRDRRAEMIDQTNAFLTWALTQERNLPRIPSRRVDQGGFGLMQSHPGVKILVTAWWDRTLDMAHKLSGD